MTDSELSQARKTLKELTCFERYAPMGPPSDLLLQFEEVQEETRKRQGRMPAGEALVHLRHMRMEMEQRLKLDYSRAKAEQRVQVIEFYDKRLTALALAVDLVKGKE